MLKKKMRRATSGRKRRPRLQSCVLCCALTATGLLALVHRAKPPVAVSSLSGARASRAPPLKLPGGGGVISLTHLPHWTGVCGGPGLVAVFKSGLVRVYGAPATIYTNKSPALTPLVTSQLPFWPGVSGAAALDVSVDLDSEDFLTSPPRAVASVGGGGGAATYAMPSGGSAWPSELLPQQRTP